MCLLVIQYRTFAAAPILIAANREEYFDRPATSPAIQPGSPRVLCGCDARAGGTWLGVNEFGLAVAITNRLKSNLPAAPRSRGALCRDLLNCPTAGEAIELALGELETGRYAGANFLCADEQTAAVIQWADRLSVAELPPGLHLITNFELDDRTDERQLIARYLFATRYPNSPGAFLDRAAEILSRGPDTSGSSSIVLRGEDRGTVSSMLLSIARPRQDSVCRFAGGPPDRTAYEDISPLLRELLTPTTASAST